METFGYAKRSLLALICKLRGVHRPRNKFVIFDDVGMYGTITVCATCEKEL